MQDIVTLRQNQKLMVSYDKKIYEGNTLKIMPEFFLVEIKSPSNKGIFNIKNGELVGFSAEVNNELVCCTSKVIGIRILEQQIILVFSNPNLEQRAERRNYVRVPLVSRVNYIMLPSYIEFETTEDIPSRFRAANNMIKTDSVDISVGGLRIMTSLEYKQGDKALIQVRVNNIDIILTGKVVRVEYIKAFKYKTAFQFIKSTKEQTEKITDYVMKYLESTS